MKRIRTLILVVIVLLAVGGVVWYLHARQPAPHTDTVTASGTIEAREVDLSPKVAGHILRLTVEEGSEVEAGQIVAELDGKELQAQVAQAAGAVDSARARLADLLRGSREEQIRQGRAALAQAQAAAAGAERTLALTREAYAKSTELKAQVDGAQAAYDAAREALSQAQARRDLVNAGPRPEAVAAARAVVAQAQAAATEADANLPRVLKLYQEGAISAQQLDAAKAKYQTTQAALAQAKAQLADLEAGARPQEKAQAEAAVGQAQAQVDGARRNLDAAQQLYSDRLTSKAQVTQAETAYDTSRRQVENARAALDLLLAGATPQAIEAARGQVAQAEGALRAAQDMTQYLTIRSPVSGRVIVKAAEQGELAVVGQPIVRIAELRRPWLRVYVPLPELRVRLGDRASVTSEAYPGREFEGTVTEVADKPEFTPKNVQTAEERVKLVFGVKIELSNPRLELKPGMPADAVIYVSGPSGG